MCLLSVWHCTIARLLSSQVIGVIITETLSWSKHCEEQRAKVSRVLGILQGNLSTCNSLTKEGAHTSISIVRPLVSYRTTAWSPYFKKDIAAIESIQRKAARFVIADYRQQRLHDASAYFSTRFKTN